MERMVFSARDIDRLGELRTQPEALDAAVKRPGTKFMPVWQGKCLVHGQRVGFLSSGEMEPYLHNAERRTLLGAIDGTPVFCVAIDDDDPPFTPPHEFVGLREIPDRLSREDAALVAYAKAMVSWQGRHRHCGVCGSRNRLREGGFVMECADPACAHRSFPRLDPAIIVLVQHEDLCLLGRKADWPPGRFSTIAGFVEPGESLEDALRREVKEETNVDAGECRYLGSQPWPFPAALMIGFNARATTTGIVCNDGELAEARWVSREQITAGEVILPPRISIAYHLVEAWFDDYDGPALASLGLPAPPLRVPRPLDEN